MPAKTIVIVPPVLLVRMFGVPEYVKMPTAKNRQVTFTAHGKQFRITRCSPRDYMLDSPWTTPHSRFGTEKEIAEDVGRVLETGSLPREKTSVY